ncbi:cytochrome P450 [Streptosporangium sp. NPDC001681]|uniref:cytochrome P450 n=1 Tax=Streptosporangium sp. NPDC001681 TaxID=3154395 RepID=UPI0033340D55
MTVDTTVDLNGLDLADPDIYTAPDSGLGVLYYLQEHRPMFWNKRSAGPSFWAFTKYADGVAVYLDKTNFTSERGMQVGQTESAARAAAGKMLIVTDGRHSRLRDVMNPALTPRVVRRLEGAMRETVGGMLEENAPRDSFDFVDTVAGRLPLSVICELLGVPRADWDLMIQWTRTAFGSATSDDVISDAEKAEANANIFAYYADLLAERRGDLGDDVISVLIRGRIDGTPLTDEEILLNINGLITGGNETTRHASAGAVIALVENPGEWRRLREDPSLIPTAVEEVLRWTAPSLNVMRTALRDTRIGEQTIRAGERVSVWHPAVNRDEDAFPGARRFDVGRTPNRHLTFGLGRHLCIGAALARFELRVLLEELTRRVAHMELTGPVKRLRSNLMWGVDRVPVHLELDHAGH